MGFESYTTTLYIRAVSILLALGLCFSFGLHSLQIPHIHYGEHHEHNSGHMVLGEYMHATDKKMFSTLLFLATCVFFVFDSAFLSWRGMMVCALRRYIQMIAVTSEQRYMQDYVSVFFRKGILHTKVH